MKLRFPVSILVLAFLSLPYWGYSNAIQDSIENIKLRIKNAKTIQKKISNMNSLIFQYAKINPDSAIHYADISVRLSKENDYEYGLVMNEFVRGVMAHKSGDHKKAKAHFIANIEGENKLEHKDFNSNIAMSKYYLGIANHQLGDLYEALDSYLSGIEHTKLAKRKMVTETIFNSAIAVIYSELKHFKKSGTYYQKCLDDAIANKDTNVLANVYFQLANDHNELEQIERSVSYLEKSQECYQALNDAYGLAFVKTLRATLSQKEGDFNMSRNFHKEARSGYELMRDKYSIIKCDLALANLEMQEFSNDKIRIKKLSPIYQELFKRAKAISNADLIMEVNKNYSSQQYKIGNYKTAYESAREFHLMKDSLEGNNVQEELATIKEEYYTKTKENEIVKINAEKDMATVLLDSSRRQNSILGIGLFIMLGFLGLLWSLYNRIKKKNLIIEQANDEKDTLLREIHHRVKNNLQVISSLLSLQSRYIKDDNALDALKQGQNRVQSMALIHQDLYQTDNLKGVEANDYFEQLLENLFDSYNISEGDIKLELEVEKLNLDVDTMIPLGLIINELVSNSLKHAFDENSTNGKVHVLLKENPDGLFLSVSDNGNGVFDITKMKGKSFGFELIESFAEKLNADLEVINDNGLSIRMNIKNYKIAA